jgi:hypothetical protein
LGTIRDILSEQKLAVTEKVPIAVARDQNTIGLSPPAGLSEGVPVLLNTTFHPDWQREDAAPIYAATPFNMLTFLDRPVHLVYRRSPIEKWAVALSAVTLIALMLPVGARSARFRFLTRTANQSKKTAAPT